MKKIAVKLLVILDNISHDIAGYTIHVFGISLTFATFHEIIISLFKKINTL